MLLSKQCENVLRILVGKGQHVGAGLNQDLSSCQVGRFLSEVGVTDRAFRFLQVGPRVVQADQVAFQGRRLECTQPTAKTGDLADHLVDHVGGTGDIAGQALGLAASQFVQPSCGTT